jgi:hypothetical protein
MADGDGAAVDVEPLLVEAELATQARICAPKASLISMRSISSERQPGRLEQRADGGAGPMPMMSGGTPTAAPATMRASGARPLPVA